tara:strand:- start:23 stop:391 length:369 start_codon:yes stop_codon:yes gene_type:complete
MLNIFKGDILHSGIGGFAAKQIAAGLMKRYAKTWTIEGFKEAKAEGKTIMDMFSVAPEWANTIKGALKKHSNLQGVSANELLSWTQDANPILFTQICQDPDLVAWIFAEWEKAKKELLSMDS